MDVVLDTNIFAQDFSMRSKKFELLFDYLEKTKSIVVVPEIVQMETIALYQRKLRENLKKYDEITRDISRITLNNHSSFPTFNEEIIAGLFLEHFHLTLSINDKDVVKNKSSYLDEVIRRATQRIRPCNDTGQEFRDTILWLAILDIATSVKDRKLVFVSNNTKQFSKDNKLHDDLLKEAVERKVEIKYYADINEFIKDHASKIDFITKEWLLSNVLPGIIDQRVIDELLQDEAMLLRWAESKGKQLTGYIDVLTSKMMLEEYFIYEKTDNSLYVQAIYEGDVEIEIEYENEDRYEYTIDEPEYTKTKVYCAEVQTIFAFTIIDKKVKDISVVEITID